MTVSGLDFTPIDPREIPKDSRGGRPSRYLATLAEFVRSGAQAVELDCSHSLNTASVAGSLRTQAKNAGLEKRVAVLHRRGRVFLVRTAS